MVDVTYMCNAACRYCRWGDHATQGRVARSLDEVLIPEETLKMLGTRRVVLSGGEPRLHPDLDYILGHYGGLVDQVVVISNGYGLDRRAAERLLEAGATGITISLDSNLVEYFKAKAGKRGYQTLINETLRRATEREELEDALRRILREELRHKPRNGGA